MATNGAKTERRREALRGALLKLIISGKLKGGGKLNELDLSRQLDTSRTPLREALLHLEREGFVRSDMRRGFSVEPLSSREVRETYPLLCELECFAVRESAHFLPLVFDELKRVNRQFAKAKSAHTARALDTRWHQTLMSQAKNARLAAIVDGLRLAISRYERCYMSDAGLVAISAKQHDDIVAAFESGDVAGGLKALEHNYRFGMQALLRKMGEE